MTNKPQFYHCGICDEYHSTQWNGDCREDAARLHPDDLDKRYGFNGWEEVDMPGGSQNGRVITLKKRGLPSVRGSRRGNQHVQIYIEVPKKLTKKQRELLEVYAETENDNITPQRRSFMESLEEYSKDRKQK
ncbi:hypothetical protein LCGC14_2987630 [marine sediment metagenome]|uniref:Chaperone DnaJ C-terminal domain-containing protein n=1 Tax=marine sediment metagenome TaxID=412755 RepID=A0A0F8ZVU7_9ZZZZ